MENVVIVTTGAKKAEMERMRYIQAIQEELFSFIEQFHESSDVGEKYRLDKEIRELAKGPSGAGVRAILNYILSL